jgi:hypothetical protein
MGMTALMSGYMAAVEVTEDMDVFDPEVFKSKNFDWYVNNIDSIPLNLGVR